MSNYDLLALLATLGVVVVAATVLRSGGETPAAAPCRTDRARRDRL